MDEKMLENEVRDEVQNVLGWIIKNKKDSEQQELVKHGHCNGFSSHCCLSCDRCWGGRSRRLLPCAERKKDL